MLDAMEMDAARLTGANDERDRQQRINVVIARGLRLVVEEMHAMMRTRPETILMAPHVGEIEAWAKEVERPMTKPIRLPVLEPSKEIPA